jgi:hypothetical protein
VTRFAPACIRVSLGPRGPAVSGAGAASSPGGRTTADPHPICRPRINLARCRGPARAHHGSAELTLPEFLLGFARTAGIVVPAAIVGRRLRLVLMLVAAEALGLVSLDHSPELIALLVALALVFRKLKTGTAQPPLTGTMGTIWSYPYAVIAVVIVLAQWCFQTANAFGGGMLSFDTLWYHMPFAAHFAQTGSVTGIQFTQADPWVAYYPANAELLHAVGIITLHSDLLSPLLNCLWLALALLASWCIGRRWNLEPVTCTAGCLLVSIPVLSGTQPGEAFNDIGGVAALLAAAVLVVEGSAAEGRGMFVVAGLALGLAFGTKLTFFVPVVVLSAGVVMAAARHERGHRLIALVGGIGLTGGWWYLRNLIAVENPVGLQAHIGPFTLPGPVSVLARGSEQSVFSQLRHVSLLTSRFLPGLDHALGPLWPIVLLLYGAGAIGLVVGRGDPTLRAIGVTAVVAGIGYLFTPYGAGGIQRGTALFQVNVRYAAPALGLGVVLLPVVVHVRAPYLDRYIGIGLAAVLAATQLEYGLWPTNTARHVLFLVGVGGAAVLWRRWVLHERPRRAKITLGVAIALVGVSLAYVVQRHYFDGRYLRPVPNNPGLTAIYAWAQHLAHANIGLYGTVEQYPLYGARVTNRVTYLGAHAANGGYVPIGSCNGWRHALNGGHYGYVVLTPAPTAPIPAAWTLNDPAATVILNPAPNYYVFRLTGRLGERCGSYRP